jgi:hypothetical protein
MRSRVLPVVVWLGLATSAAGVGLATVSAVRGVVADAPVRVLSAQEVESLLAQPEADLDPIATLTFSRTAPKLSRVDDGQIVSDPQAGSSTFTDQSPAPGNGDDEASRWGSDSGILPGGRARPVRRMELGTDDVGAAGGASWSGAPWSGAPSASPSHTATEPESPSPTPTPSDSATPSATPSPSVTTPTPTPTPTATPTPTPWPSTTASRPAPNPSAPGPRGSPTHTPRASAASPDASIPTAAGGPVWSRHRIVGVTPDGRRGRLLSGR